MTSSRRVSSQPCNSFNLRFLSSSGIEQNVFFMFKNLKEKGAKLGLGSSDNAPAPASDKGQDLSSVLDRSQRGDLTILVALITKNMRDTMERNFSVQDKSEEDLSSDKPAPGDHDGATTPAPQPAETKEDTTSLPSAEEKMHSGSSFLKDHELTTGAFSFFDDWRDSLLLRVGEVVNKDFEGSEGEEADDKPQDATQADVRVEINERSVAKLRKIYPPVETSLSELPMAKKLLVLYSLLLLVLSLKHYNSLSRVLMLHIASSLGLDIKILNDNEVKIARTLLDTALKLPANADEHAQNRKSDSSRKWKVGLASVAGATLIGVTGGLAAPLVAAGLGTVMGGLGLGATAAAGYLGALAGSGVIVGGLFGAYGGRMTGRMMDKYAREVEDFAFIPLRGPRRRTENEKEAAQQDHRLRVTIGVTGWAKAEEDLVFPWRVIGSESEVFALRWELESLLNLGHAISALVTSTAWGIAGQEILSKTIFASIMSAVMLPVGLAKVAKVADNPFSVAKARADKAGVVLADALINKVQGERPVNLIGYSLGSRVIYSCLQTLAKRRAYGLVESVILMGSPIPSNTDHWRTMRSIVSGRLVNVWSENDGVLALLYRTSSLQLGVAGLEPVEGLSGVENLDVSTVVSGHLRYQYLLGRILNVIGLQSIDIYEASREEAILATQDRQQEEERARNEQQVTAETGGKPAKEVLESGEGIENETDRLQRQADQRAQKHILPHRMEKQAVLKDRRESRGSDSSSSDS